MTALATSALNALIASLANPDHDWKVLAVSSHTEAHGLETTVDTTHQLQSEPLGTIIIAMSRSVNGVFGRTSVYFKGSSFDTTSQSLFNAIDAMAGPQMTAVQYQLESLVRQKFAQATISGSLTCTA
jgi:hypothetical protein